MNDIRQNNFKTATIWFIAMGLGALLGYLSIPAVDELCRFIASVFTRLFQFIAIPVISLAVISTLSMLGAKKDTQRIFSRTIFYTLTTTFAAAAVALLFFVLVAPQNVPLAQGASVPENLENVSYYDHFLSVIPNNLLQPFFAGNVLSVLLVSPAVGLGLAFMPDSDNRQTVMTILSLCLADIIHHFAAPEALKQTRKHHKSDKTSGAPCRPPCRVRSRKGAHGVTAKQTSQPLI